MKTPYKLLLAYEANSYLELLTQALQSEKDFRIVGQASQFKQALALIAQNQPDIVLMDIETDAGYGIMVAKTIKENFPSVKLVLLVSDSCPDNLFASLTTGADAYCLQDIDHTQLIQNLRNVMAGEICLDAPLAKYIQDFLIKNNCQ
jgi:DNA-binding NarL/FixJ family response regulator